MTAEEPLRAFFAAPVPARVAAGWEAATRAALGVGPGSGARRSGGESHWRIVPASNLHVTLRFLGETPASLVPELAGTLAAAAAAEADRDGPCAPAPREWLTLPQGRSPSVLAVRLSDPTGTLASVAASLEAAARRFGFPAERRPFLAHVTLARSGGAMVRGRSRAAAAAGVTPSASLSVAEASPLSKSSYLTGAFPSTEAFPLTELVLFSSVPGPGGPRYVRLATAPLTRRTSTGTPALSPMLSPTLPPTVDGASALQRETTANERR